jgi:hypothetical protein
MAAATAVAAHRYPKGKEVLIGNVLSVSVSSSSFLFSFERVFHRPSRQEIGVQVVPVVLCRVCVCGWVPWYPVFVGAWSGRELVTGDACNVGQRSSLSPFTQTRIDAPSVPCDHGVKRRLLYAGDTCFILLLGRRWIALNVLKVVDFFREKGYGVVYNVEQQASQFSRTLCVAW